MATTENYTVSLSKLFSQGQEVQRKIENSQMNSNSTEYQVSAVYSNALGQYIDVIWSVIYLNSNYSYMVHYIHANPL